MNKTLHIALAAAAVALAAAGCAKVGEPDAPEGQEVTITASFAENQTKTTLQDGGTAVYWEAGDEVKLFYDGTGSRFTSACTEPARTSKFTGTMNVMFGFDEGFSDSTPLWGLYPYRSDAIADNESVTTTLSSEQTGKAGSFAKGMNISLARSTSLSMGFYNVCGGVRFSVTRDDVTDVVFEALNGESVAGKVKLAFEGGVPAVQEIVEGVSSITLTAPSGGTFEVGKWYYIVALPGTLSGGFRMTFNTETKYAVLKSTDSRTIKRGKFGSLADADEGLIYRDKGTPEPREDNIVFRDNVAKVACVEKFDTDGDGELSYDEAAAVTSIAGLFTDYNSVTRFDELKYFTGITNLSSALKGLTGLKSVTVPAGATALENYAFDGCTVLDSVTFAGGNIKSVGQYAFRNCKALAEIALPFSVETVGQYAFVQCTSLSKVKLSSSLTSLGQYAFQNCAALTDIEIPSGVTEVSYGCFQGCSSLKTAGIPAGLTYVRNYAFYGCRVLESIDLPSGLKTVGEYAFRNCTAFTTVSVPDAVTSVGSGAFSGCTALESAVLPSGLVSISSELFSDCYNLYSVTFPAAVTAIGNRAFYNCIMYNPTASVSKIDLPETITSIGTESLNKVRNVLIHSSGMVSISSNTFSSVAKLYVPDAKVETYKIRTGWSAYADNIFPLSSYSDEPEVYESVDLGLSVKWATCNIGADSPEEYGTYFAWGDVAGQTWNGSSWSGGGFYSYPDYELDENNNLKPGYDAAHINLRGSWRMPTKAEQQELKDNCTSTWTSDYNGTDVAGRIFTSKKNGNSIFLPAAGCGDRGSLYDAGSYGSYWSGTFNDGNYVWFLYFCSDDVSTFSNCRSYGQSVRPVTE